MQEIKTKDIRKGDKIRFEWYTPPALGPNAGNTAVEFVAGDEQYVERSTGQHYLLERPVPPLPELDAPTPGWLHLKDGKVISGVWSRDSDGDFIFSGSDGDSDVYWAVERVQSFTEAVLVPVEAIEELSKHRPQSVDDVYDKSKNAIQGFLREVADVNDNTN